MSKTNAMNCEKKSSDLLAVKYEYDDDHRNDSRAHPQHTQQFSLYFLSFVCTFFFSMVALIRVTDRNRCTCGITS